MQNAVCQIVVSICSNLSTIKNTHQRMGVIFMAEKEGFVCIFADGENCCSHQCLHWCQQMSTGHLHV